MNILMKLGVSDLQIPKQVALLPGVLARFHASVEGLVGLEVDALFKGSTFKEFVYYQEAWPLYTMVYYIPYIYIHIYIYHSTS